MSFFLRFLKVLLQSWLKSRGLPPRSALEPSLISMRVWPNDLDLNVHMNNGRYLSLMDLGRFDLMMRAGVMRLWITRGWEPLVGLSLTRHFKALRLFQSFTLRTRLLGWDEKWIYFEQRFESKDKLYCLGLVKGLLSSKAGPVPTRELLDAAGVHEVSPGLPPYVLDWLKAERGAIESLKAEGGRA